MTTPVPVISGELKAVLRQVKLGCCLDTVPERLALASPAPWATPSSWSSCCPTR